MKVSINFKKDNYMIDCNEIHVYEDFRHYINIDDEEYRINNHESLKDAINDERVVVYDRDYCVICFDDYKYIMGPFIDEDYLVTKDVVEAINMKIFEQFKGDNKIIKLDLDNILNSTIDNNNNNIKFEMDRGEWL